MAENDKVVKLPDMLERRALKIEAAMKRRAKGDSEWIEGTLELAIELAAVRDEYGGNDRGFGGWLDTRFGNKAPSHQDRAILIQWGRTPDKIRIVLEKTESRSIQLIDRNEVTFTSASRDISSPLPPSKPATKPVTKTDAAINLARAMKQQSGKMPKRNDLARVAKVHNSVADAALRIVRAEAEAPPLQPQFNKAQDFEVEARVKARVLELEKEFNARVIAENKKQIDILFPRLEKMREDAKRTEKLYREQIAKIAILTEAEYLDILKTCHPDNVATKVVRERAFIAVNSKKLQLTGKL